MPVNGIDDFQDAVRGAGLDTAQLSNGPMTGSLAFGVEGDITYSSGRIDGKLRLCGPLSDQSITLGVGVRLAPGSRHWLRDVETGGIGVFLAGDEHDAMYMPGTTYAAATLSPERLEERAASLGKVLDARQLGGTGISDRRIQPKTLHALQAHFARLHAGTAAEQPCRRDLGNFMLEAMIQILAREPRHVAGMRDRSAYGRVVTRALAYIDVHLEEPLTIYAICRATNVSKSALFRAFAYVLDETPHSYVRKIRLNRIRHDLASEAEAACTVTLIASRWGITELGRLSSRYRRAFGELPSETLHRNAP